MKSKGRQARRPFIRLPAAVLENVTARILFWGVLFFAVTAFLVATNFNPQQVVLQEGRPSPRDFKAPRGITFESEVLTGEARKKAASEVEPVYRVEQGVLDGLLADVAEYFFKINEVRVDNASPQEKPKVLGDSLGLEVDDRVLDALLTDDGRGLSEMRLAAEKIIRTHLEQGVKDNGILAIREQMLQDVLTLGLREEYRTFLLRLFRKVELAPNLLFDAEGTAAQKEQAATQIVPVKVTIRENEKIIGEGELVNEATLEIMQEFGLLRFRSPFFTFLGLTLLVLITFMLIFYYLYQYERKVLENEKQFVLVGILLVAGVLITRVVTAISLASEPEMAAMVGYLVPVAAVSMLLAMLTNSRLAMFITMVQGIYVGLITGGELQFAVAGIVGGIVGIYSVSRLSQRSDLAKASLYIIAANMGTVLAFGLFAESPLNAVGVGLGMAVGNGFLASILTIGTLPFLETGFGITTSLRLLELSNPNQTLLKRLLMEAPGTYHHSILVGNLAEAAAEAVGADALLARVGSYYHDIGKLKRPFFFIENQLGMDNPHDRLTPNLSTLIITSHIKDGLELGREAEVPPVILDIIAQHHGASLVTYFYQKAVDNERSEVLSPADFRYEGPRPQTKEAAIVLLADSVEAGVRSLQKNSSNRLETFVRKVIKEKLEDGQLDWCDLTFKELDTIMQSFLRTLNGIFHARVEYPETVAKVMERGQGRDEALRKQPAG